MTLLIFFLLFFSKIISFIWFKKNSQSKLAMYLFFLQSGSWQEKLLFVVGILIHRFHLQLRFSV